MKTIYKGIDVSSAWKVNTVGLLQEILQCNPSAKILEHPIKIFASILYEVAERANELQDPKLLALMCRLALFEESDPTSASYNQELANRVIHSAYPELKEAFDKI